MTRRNRGGESLPAPADLDQTAQIEAFVGGLKRRLRLVRRELAEIDRRMMSDRREIRKLLEELDSIRQSLEA